MIKKSLLLLASLSALLASNAHVLDASCQLKYPIVLSHHWGARPICPDPTLTGAQACVAIEDYDRLCVAKGVDASGQRTCGQWRVPPEDADLPPRDQNQFDPTLKRSLLSYHRYFSRAIVDRLRQACGNKVYLADKPILASYEERAKSLRNTVMQALSETGAAKVIVMGMSQGAQDARYMTAVLPVSDTDAGKGQMKDKVAAVVTLAGEDGGAESASLQLDLVYLSTGGVWSDYSKAGSFWDEAAANPLFWSRTVNGSKQYVLSENCQGANCNLMTPDQRYAWSLRAMADLSTRFMRPSWLQTAFDFTGAWQSLKSVTGMRYDRWEDQIPKWKEANNGVRYLSYASSIQLFSPAFDRPEAYYGILLLAGPNDGYVSIPSQKFDNPLAFNIEHVKTFSGSILSHGYHHMFWSGRNDALYEPPVGSREAAPYDGSSADVYQQIARDLKLRGM
ncbi:MAG: hypothetical protein QM749_18570 [Aquabacterium sp.]